VPPNSLCKHHTIHKLTLIVDRRSSCLPDELVNEPIEVPLKHTFALDSVLFENRIQTRFGGRRLITTVEDLHEVFTNGSDVIAEQKHFGLLSFRVKGDFSVARLPVQGVTNGSVHLGFNLAHLGVSRSTKVVWTRLGGIATPLVPVPKLSHPPAVRDSIHEPL